MGSFSSGKLPPLIAVIHLPPLAGSPGAEGLHPADALRVAGNRAVDEAMALSKAGFQALILENFGDAPFYSTEVPPETIASLAVIAAAVRECVKIPIGINVLRNDARSALAIAAVTGCDFIRVNVLAGVTATDQGLIQGCAAELVRERNRLGAAVGILADAHVKHGRSLSSDDVAVEIEDLGLRSGADGVIITGQTTGRRVDDQTMQAALEAKRSGVSLWVGSGANAENVAEIRGRGIGVIVGSDLRKGGKAGAPLDAKRLKAFVLAAKKKTKSSKKFAKSDAKKPVRKKRKK
jgi:membrane complex biogenesis BtpA family protein